MEERIYTVQQEDRVLVSYGENRNISVDYIHKDSGTVFSSNLDWRFVEEADTIFNDWGIVGERITNYNDWGIL